MSGRQQRAQLAERAPCLRSRSPATLLRPNSRDAPSSHTITAFVDWDTARRARVPTTRRAPPRDPGRELDALQRSLAQVLAENDPSKAPIRVTLRIYHGWYQGKTKTKDLVEIERICRMPIPGSFGRVSFNPEITLSKRLHCYERQGRQCLLYDTLREREGKHEQKMVDTALVSDLLDFTRSILPHRDSQSALVVGDDDDLLPGILTARAWGAEVRRATFRNTDNPHIPSGRFTLRIKQCLS